MTQMPPISVFTETILYFDIIEVYYMKEVRKDGYIFRKSNRKNKKYDVFKNNKYIVSFGDNRYSQFKDRIGLYSHKDHNDKERRRLYYARHGKEAKKESAKYFSHKYLW
jgi:hypothetical protein